MAVDVILGLEKVLRFSNRSVDSYPCLAGRDADALGVDTRVGEPRDNGRGCVLATISISDFLSISHQGAFFSNPMAYLGENMSTTCSGLQCCPY